MKTFRHRGSVSVGKWHFAEPYGCPLCTRAHSVDEAVELNQKHSDGPVRPPWGYAPSTKAA